MRTLAIDLGAKRVGLAISDPSGQFAHPIDVLVVRDPNHALELCAEAAAEHDAEQLLVGLPLNMDGSAGGNAEATRKWAQELQQRTSLPCIMVDERLSSFHAEQQLVEQKKAGRKLTRQDKKRRLDALAAAAFLQDYLDGALAGDSL